MNIADVSRRHKATGNKFMLKQVSNPFGIFLVSFLSTDSLNIFRMSKDDRTFFFKNVINQGPIFTSRFHADFFAIAIE